MDDKYTLKEPIGELLEIQFPLRGLRSRDIILAQSEFEALTGSPTSSLLELNKNFHAFMISKLAQIPYETVLDFSVADFNGLAMRVQNFLLGGAPTPTA